MGKPNEALEAVAGCVDTRTSFAGPVLTVQAESLAAVGRLTEARETAVLAVARATVALRADVKKRLSSLLERT